MNLRDNWRRLRDFVRDLLPEQFAQFLFPFAAFLLIVGVQTAWVEPTRTDPLEWLGRNSSDWPSRVYQILGEALTPLFALGPLPQFIASVSGLICLYVSFWAPNRWESILRRYVILPASLIGALTVGRVLLVALTHGPGQSMMEPFKDRFAGLIPQLPNLLRALGPGFYSLPLSLVVLSSGLWLARGGRVKLPVRFRGSAPGAVQSGDDAQLGRRILFYCVFLFAIPWLTWPIGLFLAKIWSPLVPNQWGPDVFAWWFWIPSLFAAVIPAAGAVYFMGERRWEELRRIFRPGPWRMWLAAIGLGFGPTLVSRAALYVWWQIRWYFPALRDMEPLPFFDLFPLPSIWMAIFLPLAVLEEIAFRGFLQPRAIRLHGLRRGIFLVSMIWASIHLHLDVGGASSVLRIVLGVTFRFLVTGVLSVVLGWLFLKSGTIWPVSLAHALYNVSREGNQLMVRVNSPALGYLEGALWILAAYWLFKRFPPRVSSIPPGSAGGELSSIASG